jgi:hypothetical protein
MPLLRPDVTASILASNELKQEETMGSRGALRAFLAAMVGLASAISTLAGARAQDVPGTIADHDSIFIDGKSFKITPGRGKADAPIQSKALGARELGSGAVIFRSGEKLYIVDAPLLLPVGGGGRQSVYLNADEEQPIAFASRTIRPRIPSIRCSLT